MRKIILTFIFVLVCSPVWAAIDFDGTDDNVEITGITGLGNTVGAASVWVNFDDWATGSSGGILSVNDGTANNRILMYHSDTGGGESFLYLFGVAGGSSCGNFWALQEDDTFTNGTWYHLSFRWDTPNDEYFIHKNGVALTPTTSGNCGNFSGLDEIDLGTIYDDSSLPFNGQMDDVTVYDIEVGTSNFIKYYDSKMKRLAQQLTFSDNLVVYLPLDDGADGTSADGDTFRDESGKGNTATGNDGANNTGLTWTAGAGLSYP